ncbi:biotin-dependent carboxyltransferase family protein [Nocardioides sp. LHG3406-4]|uniref:5-oxoprolinase subunit C family protein n=1 Tax=Nocardioides sp. LHG3406-4 TaxID=2804575 RepID=UPI003CE76CEE
MSLRIVDAGALTTIQDRGRFGLAHLGVPRAGALDAPAADLANRLVGNASGAALLETTAAGVSFDTGRAHLLAVTGARCAVRVAGRWVAFAEPVSVPAGALVEVGPAIDGMRSYVAVAGGIDVDPVLGSRSTDTLAWVGPPVLRAGDVLPVGPTNGDLVGVDVDPRRRPPSVLRLHPGPHADWFAADVLARLDGASYEVASESNRVGLRLSGRPIHRTRSGELLSEGMVLGAVQVPPSGQPVVFLNDHPATGGYPVVAVLHEDDLPVCAQARPGDVLTLRPA